MNLIKWFRKNQTKIMAVVVVILLIGFIGGAALQQILEQLGGGRKKLIAYYGENKKITISDYERAYRELQTLKILKVPVMLRNLPLFTQSYKRVLNLNTLFLADVLFSDTSISPASFAYIKQIRAAQAYTISDEQLNETYKYPDSGVTIWFLLKSEAEQAGVNTSIEEAKSFLVRLIPQLFEGAKYKQVMDYIINPPPRSQSVGIPEKEILQTFARLLDVIDYSQLICSSENVTEQQIKYDVYLSQQTIDTEFVRIAASVFTDDIEEPNDPQITSQFETYKEFIPGRPTDDNPCGFGYMLPDRVALQYIVVSLEDIERVIEKPTQQQALDFYQSNRDRFTQQVPSDPNDPNSAPTTRIQTYPEVAALILEKLKIDRIESKANEILQKAKSLTEAEFEADTGSGKITKEQFEKIAGNCKNSADRLSEEYKLKIYTGRTGLLSTTDIQKDEYLGGLFLEGYGYNPLYNPNRIWLNRIVFAVDEIATSRLGVFDVQKPQMFENIGPLKDISANIRALVRIVQAEKTAPPENVNLTFTTETLSLDEPNNQDDQNLFSVRQKVTEDLKNLAAMKIAKQKADDFNALAAETDWQNAVNKFNQLYPTPDSNEADPNNFRLITSTGIPRMTNMQLKVFIENAAGNPGLQPLLDNLQEQNRLIEKLYSLVPTDANALPTPAPPVEFKSQMSYYCIKKLTINLINQGIYEAEKAPRMYEQDIARSQSIAAVHFNPGYILERMNYKQAGSRTEPTPDANQPAETEAGTL